MSIQTYDTRRRADAPARQATKLSREGPSMDALRSGAAAPTREMRGSLVDLSEAIRARTENTFGTGLERTMAGAGERVCSGPVTGSLSAISAASAAGPMQAKKPWKPDPRTSVDEGYEAFDPNLAGKVNQDRDVGSFWVQHMNSQFVRPGTENITEEFRQKYSGPAYKENSYVDDLRNADKTERCKGLGLGRSVTLLRGYTGAGVSKSEMDTLYDNLMAGHQMDLNHDDPEAIQAANGRFSAGIRQLKGIYYNQLKRLRDNYGTMLTQMHPEDIMRQMKPDFSNKLGLLQDTEQLLVSPDMQKYFDFENSEEDQEFKRLSDYYNNAYSALTIYGVTSAGAVGRPVSLENLNSSYNRTRAYDQAMALESQIGGPGMSEKERKKYLRGLRKRSKKRDWKGALFGRFLPGNA